MNKNVLLFSLFAMLLVGLSFAESTGQTEQITKAVCAIYNDINTILPALVMGLVALAAGIYAAGQFFSADVRSRAAVWANSMLIGAAIGIIIYLVVPAILGLLFGKTLSC